ncbi:hypothetical protein BV898_19109 [Hypsibius exemplaris]|uniref:Uncharacterized protein n=1 Tax=Hypsibius exemplaris TaxID=2072580 RepID=A0A9X6RNS8_HYPEX|nr:hypothetical protein BV898_19109 [Hypsibius exemplaris]
MLNLQLCNSLILFCALVSPCQGVKKVSISQSYTGQCDGDDETCVESCNDDKLCGGKCGAFRNVRVCYCEGCHQGETTRNRTPAPVRPSQDKEKLCFSKSYFGQCDGDDEACVQSCNDDKLSGGKCGAFGSVRVCFCEGRHQGVTAPNRTPAPVSPSQDKELCFSKSYFGQCDGDDEACVQSCNDDKLSGGKCGAYKSARICYCEGCHQSETGTVLM